MSGRLVLIGGTPGVGKTTLLQRLPALFERCACLDADDLLRVHPADFDPALGDIWENNVISVLREHLDAGFPFVFLAWVLADPKKIERILSGLEGHFESARIVHLTASPDALAPRSAQKIERGLIPEYQRFKSQQIEALPFEKLDTTQLQPDQVARAVRDFAIA